MKVAYYVFKDFKLDGTAATDEEILQRGGPDAEKLRELRYSFVSMCPHPARGKLFLGCTNWSGDILLEFDLAAHEFRSCGYGKSDLWDYRDAKIHKGLWLDEAEDAIYFGTATMSEVPEMVNSPGGKLVRYDVEEGEFTCLAVPIPEIYYQGTVYDARRKRMHMFTGKAAFASYDLKEKKLVRHFCVESVPHNGCLDDRGGVWGCYGRYAQALFRYDPDEDRFEFPEGCRFPNAREAANIQFLWAGPVDSIINGGDGFLYTGSALGELYRLDPRTAELKFLGKPFPDKRLPGLGLGPDGWLYLCGGSQRASMLARYSREEERFEFLGSVEHEDGTYLHYAHELAVIDGVVYIGETDNPARNGYLWACEL